MLNKIIIKISDKRLWIIDYNLAGAIIFIPITLFALLILHSLF